MDLTRRQTLGLGLTTLAALGITTIIPRTAFAQSGGQTYPTDNGEIVVHPISHASLVLETPSGVIYVDPVEGAELYADLPPPDLILITHEHGDHFDLPTLEAIIVEGTEIIANPAVFAMLPEALAANAREMANGDTDSFGDIAIEAIPAYNTTEDRLQYHPQGRDNGYVLDIDGSRVYIAGDTEDIPEMRALENIAIAFVPMNLPFTMTVEQAASGVAAFAPTVVYPYHYGESDIDLFEELLTAETDATEVVRGEWY
ncbi:MBL fold metallo-hydrolase [Pelagibacterium luteolum]|uniref:L-ascorbate metabolism protein UlaG, beta-lactamase superfamily n=1 Tax=Pelagibacterium luteolum TaxID=440168 RepID=A0A1G7SDW3_9HYPH|nr:MBL fold metallo-hydrolase [Pelagibacterium luteolum]SDG21161.1 L-ascorbate metabolism protein UlaG, beta-lactamase superfamily [Pelagibacterium luteolum]